MTGARPITIRPTGGRAVVRANGEPIAETRASLTLMEADLPPVHYFPRADVTMARLAPSATRSRCPYKGEASYFALDGVDIAWSYEDPIDAVAAIAGMLAFYPSRVDGIDLISD